MPDISGHSGRGLVAFGLLAEKIHHPGELPRIVLIRGR